MKNRLTPLNTGLRHRRNGYIRSILFVSGILLLSLLIPLMNGCKDSGSTLEGDSQETSATVEATIKPSYVAGLSPSTSSGSSSPVVSAEATAGQSREEHDKNAKRVLTEIRESVGDDPEGKKFKARTSELLESGYVISQKYAVGPMTALDDFSVFLFPHRSMWDQEKQIPGIYNCTQLTSNHRLSFMPRPMVRFAELEVALKNARKPTAAEMTANRLAADQVDAWRTIELTLHLAPPELLNSLKESLASHFACNAAKIQPPVVQPLAGMSLFVKTPGMEQPRLIPKRLSLGWQQNSVKFRLVVPKKTVETDALTFERSLEISMLFEALGFASTYDYAADIAKGVAAMSNKEIIDVLASAYQTKMSSTASTANVGLGANIGSIWVGGGGGTSTNQMTVEATPILLTGEDLSILTTYVANKYRSYSSRETKQFEDDVVSRLTNVFLDMEKEAGEQYVADFEAREKAKQAAVSAQAGNSGPSGEANATGTGVSSENNTEVEYEGVKAGQEQNGAMTPGATGAQVGAGTSPVSKQVTLLTEDLRRKLMSTEAVAIDLALVRYTSPHLDAMIISEVRQAVHKSIASKLLTFRATASEVTANNDKAMSEVHAKRKFAHVPLKPGGNPIHGDREGALSLQLDVVTKDQTATATLSVSMEGEDHLYKTVQQQTFSLPANFRGFGTPESFTPTASYAMEAESNAYSFPQWARGEALGISSFKMTDFKGVASPGVELHGSSYSTPYATNKYTYRAKTGPSYKPRWVNRCCRDADVTGEHVDMRFVFSIPLVVESEPKKTIYREMRIPVGTPVQADEF